MDIAFLALIAVLGAVTIGLVYGLERLRGSQMSWVYVLSGIAAAALFVYLVVAMLKPEWFE